MADIKYETISDSRADDTAWSVRKEGGTFILEKGKADADVMDFTLAVYEHIISASLVLSERCDYRISPQSALDVIIAQMTMASTIFERDGLDAVMQEFSKDSCKENLDDFCISLMRDERRWYIDAGYVSNAQFITAMLVMGTEVRKLASHKITDALPFLAVVASNARVYADDVFRAIEEGTGRAGRDDGMGSGGQASGEDLPPC